MSDQIIQANDQQLLQKIYPSHLKAIKKEKEASHFQIKNTKDAYTEVENEFSEVSISRFKINYFL